MSLTAAAALAAMTVLVGLTVLARALPGRDRTAAAAAAATARLGSIEALDKVEKHCLIEHRPTLHVRLRTGDVMCLDCRNTCAGGK